MLKGGYCENYMFVYDKDYNLFMYVTYFIVYTVKIQKGYFL